MNFEKTKKIIENLEIKKNHNISKKKIQIPICCEDEYALDLKKLERKLNKPNDEILDRFFSKEYFCYMTGFKVFNYVSVNFFIYLFTKIAI